jgi:CheY-like chemotaxis protein
MPVLVATQDVVLRSTLCTLLEDQGYYVMAVARGLTAFTLLARSSAPLVVLLDAELGDHAAAEQLLGLARAGSPWVCHAYVVVSTTAPEHWSLRLRELVEADQLPVLTLPRDLAWLLPVVRQVQATPRAGCGCMARIA